LIEGAELGLLRLQVGTWAAPLSRQNRRGPTGNRGRRG
jgi:hypothetical protein